MEQQNHTQSIYQEGRIALAIEAINQNQFESERRATATYDIDQRTLRRRRAGIQARRDCEANSKKLTKREELVIIVHILDLDSRGFPPRLSAVRDMANLLLAERAASQVGKNWPENFIRRTPEVKTVYNRKYDYQRAKCEDPEIIAPWFDLVRRTIRKHGIATEDIHNFDETGFQMGVISTGVVVTGSERRNRRKTIQPGNREWVTVIHSISARGESTPPFIIFASTYHLSAWYTDNDLPHNSAIAISKNGWTTNELGVAWLQHFQKYTKDRTIGTHRLLTLDGHESHESLEFKQLCEKYKIVTLCMSAHSSHLLQPLDVDCFSPLKKTYVLRST